MNKPSSILATTITILFLGVLYLAFTSPQSVTLILSGFCLLSIIAAVWGASYGISYLFFTREK